MRRPRAAGSATSAPVASTRERIVDAAIATLREEGFAATSARAIARRGKFNQALIFYHFGSLIELLVAALQQVSADRLAEYQLALDGVDDLAGAVAVARRQYRADLERGHITVLTEMVAGASSVPQLAPEIVRCVEPWLAFTEEQIHRHIDRTALATLVPARQAAQAVIAIYLGMEMLDHLDPGAGTADPLFHVAERMLEALEPLLGRRPRAPASRPRRVPIDT